MILKVSSVLSDAALCPIPVYTELPANYPQLPLNDLWFQPAAYTQGKNNTVYVTVLIPLPPNQQVVPPETIERGQEDGSIQFIYNIELRKDGKANASDTLAYFTFSFRPDLPAGTNFKLRISVIAAPGTDELGKVVMDSNMLPTNPK